MTTTASPTDRQGGADQPAPNQRLHDLDALRGFAMWLGIVLHTLMAFFPIGFWVTDETATNDKWFDELQEAIHGFRMPLFFMLSGFFTTMVWRRRGLLSLSKQRALRVAAPLAIGLVTIIPLMAVIADRASDQAENDADLRTAVNLGITERVIELAATGEPVDVALPDGNTLLHDAASFGNLEIAEVLVANGADVNALQQGSFNPDGTSPLDVAVAGGHVAMADWLVDQGAADPRAPGEEWTDLPTFGLLAFDQGSADPFLVDDLYHLWFLWFLVIFVIGFVAVAAMVERLPLPPWTERWVGRLMWLLIPINYLAHVQMADKNGLEFGPAPSATLNVTSTVLIYHATFFTFGALMWGRTGPDGAPLVRTVGRFWPASLLVALAVMFPLSLDAIHDGRSISTAVIFQVGYAWLMIFGLMGLFRRVLGKESFAARYLSDASYWLYLAHLPIIVFLQTEVRTWDIPAELKILGIITITTALLLVTYQLFVRYTPVGWLLNGRRTRRTETTT